MNVDSIVQNAFTAFKNIKWRDCEQNKDYEWYYAENMHYVIRQKKTNAYWFIKSKSPITALETVLNKLAQNEVT